ncbi:MAG: signal peptidase II [Elusimicrobia bacterium CG_4_10_14_0_2_um_filter_56_8]|nr:MAG: signal peptidase II [Elusimicrobia bacterium CG1_02_56_21]PJA15534.1 MAG: signal peptidase II [Elusimicrobia bacterium CG_4_10_14_0_2_um_filter_56_8]
MKKLAAPAVILAVFLLDRASKSWALKALYFKSVKIFSFFHLTYAENTGVAFGMFRDSNKFFLIFSLVLVGVLLFLRRRIEACGRAAALGLALVLGGALGNIYDRIAYGFVVDYFDFSFFPAVFNIADSAITSGAVLLALGVKEQKPGTGESGIGNREPGKAGKL